MNWPTYMKTADADCPPSATLDVQGQTEHLIRAGASLRGAVYRGQLAGSYYRLIPLRLAPVEWRFAIQQAVQEHSPPGAIAPDRAWQPADLSGFLCVRYPGQGVARTLAEVLQREPAADRLRALAAVLRAAETWQRNLPRPLAALPADIVIGNDGAQLLGLPVSSTAPTVDCAFCQPEAALHLPPEVIRSGHRQHWQSAEAPSAVDRFTLGVSVLAAFYSLPLQHGAEWLLPRAAAATTLKDLPKRPDLPAWLDEFPVVRQALALARRLAAPAPETRRRESLPALAALLDQCAEQCDPRRAAQELCDFGRPLDALSLLQAVFPMAESYALSPDDLYELLVRAGDISSHYLARPLEAIDFYDRAIDKCPQRVEAYEAQLRLITTASDAALMELVLRDDSASVQLDVRAWRSFRGVGRENQPQFAYPMARYLNWRGQYTKAIPFCLEHLFDAEGNYEWWNFDLNLEYVRALLEAAQPEQAHEQLQQVKQGLQFVQANQSMEPDAIEHFGALAAELERLILERRGRRA